MNRLTEQFYAPHVWISEGSVLDVQKTYTHTHTRCTHVNFTRFPGIPQVYPRIYHESSSQARKMETETIPVSRILSIRLLQ